MKATERLSTVTVEDEIQFWALLHRAIDFANGDPTCEIEYLVDELVSRPVREIAAFELCFRNLRYRAYRAELWGAAFLINGGCSDDGFEYFRAWLVAQGRSVYESALLTPDSLAEVNTGECAEFEEFMYLGTLVIERVKCIDDMETLVCYPKYPDLVGDNALWSTNGVLDESKAKILYPRLSAKFLDI